MRAARAGRSGACDSAESFTTREGFELRGSDYLELRQGMHVRLQSAYACLMRTVQG